MTMLPLRMALINLQIRQLLTDTDLIDEDYRYQKGNKDYDTAVVLRGQLIFRKEDDRARRYTGDADSTDGHMVFKQSYLGLQGFVFKKGDRLVGIAQYDGSFKSVDYEITQVEERGHLPSSIILFIFFTQRSDTRSSM